MNFSQFKRNFSRIFHCLRAAFCFIWAGYFLKSSLFNPLKFRILATKLVDLPKNLEIPLILCCFLLRITTAAASRGIREILIFRHRYFCASWDLNPGFSLSFHNYNFFYYLHIRTNSMRFKTF